MVVGGGVVVLGANADVVGAAVVTGTEEGADAFGLGPQPVSASAAAATSATDDPATPRRGNTARTVAARTTLG